MMFSIFLLIILINTSSGHAMRGGNLVGHTSIPDNTLISRANIDISCNPDKNAAIRRGLEQVIAWSRLAVLSAANDNYSDYERALFVIHFQIDTAGRRRIVRDRFRAMEHAVQQTPGGPILLTCFDMHGLCGQAPPITAYVPSLPILDNTIVLVGSFAARHILISWAKTLTLDVVRHLFQCLASHRRPTSRPRSGLHSHT